MIPGVISPAVYRVQIRARPGRRGFIRGSYFVKENKEKTAPTRTSPREEWRGKSKGKAREKSKRKKMYNNATRAMLPSPNLPSRPQISVAPPLMPVTSIPHVPRQRPSPAKITPGRCTVWFVQSRFSSRRGGQERRAVVAEEGLAVLWGLLFEGRWNSLVTIAIALLMTTRRAPAPPSGGGERDCTAATILRLSSFPGRSLALTGSASAATLYTSLSYWTMPSASV